jgi:hypothetical protein
MADSEGPDPPTENRRADREERNSSPRQDRRRSQSPRRDRRDDRRPRKDKGFKWKDKRRDDDDRRDRDSGYQRGYRDHYKPRSRSRSPRRDQSPRRPRSPRHDRDDPDRIDDTRRKLGNDDKSERKERKEKKEKKPAPAMPQQPMIRVTVNDRLGTKHTIPCFPSDPIGEFKKIVSAYIGRPAHEILLKRQGERPFKDQLTLQDYGVSNDVQLDLEVDTGD